MVDKKKSTAVPSDLGNDRARGRRAFRLSPVSASNPRPRVRMTDQRNIDKYLEMDMISHEEWEVAETFHRLAFSSGLTGGGNSHLAKMVRGTVGGRGDPMETKVDASMILAKELLRLRLAAGPIVSYVFSLVAIGDITLTKAAVMAGKRKTVGLVLFKTACKTLLAGK